MIETSTGTGARLTDRTVAVFGMGYVGTVSACCLADQGALYCYQSGLDPDHLDDEPGRILLLILLRRALRLGFSSLDLLRGNEPYKSHLGAKPQASLNVFVGNRDLLGRAAFSLTQFKRRSRRLAGQVLRHVRPP